MRYSFIFLFPFLLFLFFLPHFSSFFFFLSIFLFSLFLFFLSLLFWFPLLSPHAPFPSTFRILFSSSIELIHSLPLSILVTHGFHVSPSHSFPLTSVLHDTSISFPCDTWPLSFLPCGIYHPNGPSCDGHDAVWHHATRHCIICPFYHEIREISTGLEFNVIHQGS